MNAVRRTLLQAAAALVLLAGTMPIYSADEAPASETPTQAEGEDRNQRPAPAPEAPTPPARPRPSPEVFVPSEDISEDLSVRFPVDI